MKRIFRVKEAILSIFICLTLFFILSVPAISDDVFKVEYTVEFSQEDLSFGEIHGYDIINLGDRNYLNLIGKPMLPLEVIKIALPEGMSVEKIRIINQTDRELTGEYNIFPAQPPIEINRSDAELTFIEPEPNIYNSLRPYPEEQAQFIRQSDLAGQAIAEVKIYPLQYTPVEKKIKLITSITFVLEGSNGYQCGDYLPDNISAMDREMYIRRLTEIVNNPEDVAPVKASSNLKLSMALPSDTPFDHLIITSAADASYYQPLVDWHYRKGVRDTAISTEYIYASYDGADEKEKIRNFIIDAHQNWGTLYFLLGGEQSTIPFAYRNYENTNVPSDAYYADYDDDWEYEVYVGRMTAEGSLEISRFVNKVLKYETDPPLLNYALDATLVGMDLTVASDPPYYTLTRGETMKDLIDVEHIPSRFGVTAIYDTEISNHLDDFKNALNDGQNLVNHCDHSNYSVMCIGDRNHNWCFYIGDIYNLTNYHRYSVIYSLGCHANRMDINDAISEHFIFGTDSTGAVAFTGNTRSGWFYVGDPLSLSSDLDIKWWVGLFDHNRYRLGEALAYCKSASNVESSFPFCEWTLNLLGEPEMPLWTDLPTTMLVSHSSELNATAQNFDVHVEKFGGVNIEQAFVCLWMGSDIYERGYTDADGDVSFSISPTINGTMYVTVTKQNHLPYLGEAEVIGNVSPICHVPNDTVVFQCTPSTISLPVGCTDDDGNLASGPELVRGLGEIVGGYWQFTPSMGEDSIAVTIRCEDSLGYYCETTFIVYFDFNDIPLCQIPNDTSISQMAPVTEINLPVFAEDPDNNIIESTILSGPGELSGDYWNYTPTNDEVIDVSVRFTDDCGTYCEDSFQISYIVYTCGDPDGDLDVNIFDVTYLISYLYMEGPAPEPLLTGNPNGDEAINIFDVTFLISFLYSGGPPPVCP